MIMKYLIKRPFASHRSSLLEQKGDIAQYPKSIGDKLVDKGLMIPYETKEDKRVMVVSKPATIQHDGGPMFLVVQGKQVIDRVKGKEKAQQIADSINGIS